MDEIDVAQLTEAAIRADQIARARQRETVPPVWIDGVACCAECGEPIPAARLAACPDAGRCVLCQAEYEETKRWTNS